MAKTKQSAKSSKAKSSAAPASDALVRLNLDIPEELHKRMKMQCAAEGVSMKTAISSLLEKRFPKKTGK